MASGDISTPVLTHDLNLLPLPAGTGKTYLAVAARRTCLNMGSSADWLARPGCRGWGTFWGFCQAIFKPGQTLICDHYLTRCHDMMDFEQVKRFISTM